MAIMNLLAGKTAIITGGITGIGRAITLEYLAQGCSVAVNYLGQAGDAAHLESLMGEAGQLRSQSTKSQTVGALFHQPGDVRDPATSTKLISDALKHFGRDRLDVCVANAGICTFADFLTLDAALAEQTVGTNLLGALYTAQAAARQMSQQTLAPSGLRGSIIGMASISALVGGAAQTHYTPTKAGVLSLMQSAAAALGSRGIRCNSLLPGTIETALNAHILADETARRKTESRIALGRVGAPPDLAGPAVFLACDELSGYVSGAQVLVDGGAFVNFQ